MSEWKEYILEDVIEKFIDYRGKTPRKTSFGIPLMTAKIIKGGRLLEPTEYIAKEDYFDWMTRGFPEINDVLLTTEAPLGEVALVKDKNVALGQRIITLQTRKDLCDSVFLKYYLQSFEGQATLQSRASGSTVEGIKSAELKKIEISLPPLTEQKNIALILFNLDNKIDLLHRQNATLEKMAETLFRQWFVERFPEPVEGEAKEEWEVKQLKEITDIAIGRTPPRKESKWFSTNPKDIKWISIKDLGDDGVFISNTSEYLTKEAVETFNIPVIPKDTVVLSFKMTVGRVAITFEEMLSNEAIAHFKFNNKTPFSKEYLYIFLKTFKYETLGSTSSIVTAINSAMIKEMEILIPDEFTMNAFKNETEPLFNKIKTNQTQIGTLTALRDTLLPKLMSGEVRVEN
jgi:type I restriction enzyme S subunit